MSTETTVAVPDGEFTLHVWTPESGPAPGILLVQEIWGVSDYIRAVAEDLAALGYVVASPDLFWRLRPGWCGSHDEEGLRQSLELSSHFDPVKGLDDLEASLNTLRRLSGNVGLVGFCLGGTLAYGLAARVDGISAVVSFYGSGVADQLDLLERIDCPLQFHYGGSDPYIPRERVAAVEQAVAEQAAVEQAAVGRSDVEIHVEEDAGHAFHNRKAPMFYVPDAADRAWRLTEDFLAGHLTPKHLTEN
jgi:carboxymethylenebutenolidase